MGARVITWQYIWTGSPGADRAVCPRANLLFSTGLMLTKQRCMRACSVVPFRTPQTNNMAQLLAAIASIGVAGNRKVYIVEAPDAACAVRACAAWGFGSLV